MSLLRMKCHIAPWLVPWASRSLQRAAERTSEAEKWVDLVFHNPLWRFSITPLQIPEEITALLHILRDEPPRRVLELGTATGGTLFLLTRVATDDAVLVSVDLPWGSGGGYPPWRDDLYTRFARSGQNIHLIQEDSHRPETLEAVREALGGPIDFLLIDGDHSYKGAQRDWKMYGPSVRSGGLVAFHDIVPGPERLVGGVPKLWREMRERHAYRELVADWDQGGCGLGLIKKR